MGASQKERKYSPGFTIVELLIVIVVIAILAAITIVAYNGIQGRADLSRRQTDLKNITKALALYHTDHGSYPISEGRPGCTNHWCGWDQVTGDDFIPGLSPQYIHTIPQMPPDHAANDTYLYRSNGVDYQLIRFKGDGLPMSEMQNNPLLITSGQYDRLAWGYKTHDGNWW